MNATARPRHPHHGLAAPHGPRYREFGGSFIYPMGEDMVTIGMVVGLDYPDAELSVHDLLQELKTHPKSGASSREASASSGVQRRFPRAATSRCRGRSTRRDSYSAATERARERARAEGRPLRDRIQEARGRGLLRAVRRGASPATALGSYDDALRESFVRSDLREVRNMRQAFGHGFWLGGALAGAMTVTKGRFPPGNRRTERDSEQSLISTRRSRHYPAADGKPRSTSSRPSSRRATRPGTTSRTTSACRRACPSRSVACGSRCARRRSTNTSTGGCRYAVELRPVRSDHREGRPPDPAGGRLRPGVQALVTHV